MIQNNMIGHSSVARCTTMPRACLLVCPLRRAPFCTTKKKRKNYDTSVVVQQNRYRAIIQIFTYLSKHAGFPSTAYFARQLATIPEQHTHTKKSRVCGKKGEGRLRSSRVTAPIYDSSSPLPIQKITGCRALELSSPITSTVSIKKDRLLT